MCRFQTGVCPSSLSLKDDGTVSKNAERESTKVKKHTFLSWNHPLKISRRVTGWVILDEFFFPHFLQELCHLFFKNYWNWTVLEAVDFINEYHLFVDLAVVVAFSTSCLLYFIHNIKKRKIYVYAASSWSSSHHILSKLHHSSTCRPASGNVYVTAVFSSHAWIYWIRTLVIWCLRRCSVQHQDPYQLCPPILSKNYLHCKDPINSHCGVAAVLLTNYLRASSKASIEIVSVWQQWFPYGKFTEFEQVNNWLNTSE